MDKKNEELNKELRKLFLDSCYENLKNQKRFGCMPSGHNGSYLDEETPARNTAHWIISFVKAYELTGEECFYNAIVSCLKFILSDKNRPNGKTFYCRKKESKDKCNGLIGQAWVIEGLIEGYKVIGDIKPLELAKEVFLLHPFCEKRKMWYRIEPDGEKLGLDLTFNHQLWFAMSGFLITNTHYDKTIESRCLDFFDSIPNNLKLSNNGRIGQSVRLGVKDDIIKYNLKKIFRKEDLYYMKLKEIGYHAFNTYAFSIIFDLYPNLTFFKTKAYGKIINYLNSSEYKNNIYTSNYGFKYNPPGFEFLRTYKTHKSILYPSLKFMEKLLNFHIDYNYDEVSCSFIHNVHDKNTSAARIYELSSSL